MAPARKSSVFGIHAAARGVHRVSTSNNMPIQIRDGHLELSSTAADGLAAMGCGGLHNRLPLAHQETPCLLLHGTTASLLIESLDIVAYWVISLSVGDFVPHLQEVEVLLRHPTLGRDDAPDSFEALFD